MAEEYNRLTMDELCKIARARDIKFNRRIKRTCLIRLLTSNKKPEYNSRKSGMRRPDAYMKRQCIV